MIIPFIPRLFPLFRFGVAATVIGAGTAAFMALHTQNITRPIPNVRIKHKVENNRASVDVFVENANFGPLPDVSFEHKNLDCLTAKGYTTSSIISGNYSGPEPVLELRKHHVVATHREFLEACKECNVSTEVKCKGMDAKTFAWAEHSFGS